MRSRGYHAHLEETESMPISSIDTLKETLEYLEVIFRPQLPKVTDTLAEVQRKAGQQDVLEHLRLTIAYLEETPDV